MKKKKKQEKKKKKARKERKNAAERTGRTLTVCPSPASHELK